MLQSAAMRFAKIVVGWTCLFDIIGGFMLNAPVGILAGVTALVLLAIWSA